MKTLGTALVVLFAGLSASAQALETSALCDVDNGAPVASYMAFVVDWNDFGLTSAPTLESVASVAPGPELIDPVQTSAMVAQIDPVAVVPLQRPAVQAAARPQLVAEELPARPSVSPMAPVPMPWPTNLRGVWFIGSFR